MPSVRMNNIPEPFKTELLWLGFGKDMHISHYMYKMLLYCKGSDSIRLKQIYDMILDECKKQYRHAWSDCYGGADHTVFGGGCYPEAEKDHMDNNFKYWITPILDSNMDDSDVRKMRIDLDRQIAYDIAYREKMKAVERLEEIRKRGEPGFFERWLSP